MYPFICGVMVTLVLNAVVDPPHVEPSDDNAAFDARMSALPLVASEAIGVSVDP